MSQRQMLGLERDNKSERRRGAIPHRGGFELLMSFVFGEEEEEEREKEGRKLVQSKFPVLALLHITNLHLCLQMSPTRVVYVSIRFGYYTRSAHTLD